MADSHEEQLPHNEGFIISEAPGTLSREEVTIVQHASVLHPGTVMGKRDDGNWEQFDPDSSEGNDTARGILCSRVDATEGTATGVVIERLAEVREGDLIWDSGVDTSEKNAALVSLDARNIKVRSGPSRSSTQST